MSELFGILFLTIVAPVWIIAHYTTRNRTMNRLTPEDETQLGDLWESAKRMEERIQTLERILDDSAPNWRSRL